MVRIAQSNELYPNKEVQSGYSGKGKK